MIIVCSVCGAKRGDKRSACGAKRGKKRWDVSCELFAKRKRKKIK
jgi:hypothetical protein